MLLIDTLGAVMLMSSWTIMKNTLQPLLW